MRTNAVCQYSDTIKLFDYGFNNYTAHSISSKEQTATEGNSILFTRYNSILDKDNPIIHTSENNYFVLPNGAKAKDVKQNIDLYDSPKERNGKKIIGQITYSFDSKTVGAVDIYYVESSKPTLEVTSHDISETDDTAQANTANTQKDSKRDLKPLIIAAIIIVFCLLYAIYYMIIERPRRSRRKAYYQKRKSRNFDDSLF
jgi:D-alanyl-D-alanine carboxypeptidase